MLWGPSTLRLINAVVEADGRTKDEGEIVKISNSRSSTKVMEEWLEMNAVRTTLTDLPAWKLVFDEISGLNLIAGNIIRSCCKATQGYSTIKSFGPSAIGENYIVVCKMYHIILSDCHTRESSLAIYQESRRSGLMSGFVNSYLNNKTFCQLCLLPSTTIHSSS